MMEKKRLAIISMGIALTILSTGAIWAQPAGVEHQGKKQHEFKMEKMVKELNLTPQQTQALEASRASAREQGKAVREKMQAARSQLQQELSKPDSDKATVERLAGDLKQLTGQMIDEHIKGTLELKKILSPEQFKAFQEKTKAMHEQRKGRMQERGE